jgi:hypothetical protein
MWWPEEQDAKVKILQNIIFVKVHPLKDVESLLSSSYILDAMIKSLFQSLPPTLRQNFEKTVFKSCEKDNFYTVLSYAMGEIAFQKLIEKRKFTPFKEHFDNKKDNLKAILFSELYQSETKQRRKFFGEFPNKLKFICDQLDF